MDVCDAKGERLIQFRMDADGRLHTSDGQEESVFSKKLPRNKWVEMDLHIDSKNEKYSLYIDGDEVCKGQQFTAPGSAERIEFRTGEYRLDRKIQEYKTGNMSIPGFDEISPGEPVEEAVFYLRDFSVEISE
jgi:hypothetical protein